MDEAENDADPE